MNLNFFGFSQRSCCTSLLRYKWACKRSCFSSSKVLRQISKQHAHEGACKSAASCSAKAENAFQRVWASCISLTCSVSWSVVGFGGRFGPSSRTPQSPWNVKRAVCVFRISFGFCSSASHGHCRTANCKTHGGAPVQCKKCRIIKFFCRLLRLPKSLRPNFHSSSVQQKSSSPTQTGPLQKKTVIEFVVDQKIPAPMREIIKGGFILVVPQRCTQG